MDKNIKISIICAVYNTEEYIEECLNSIIKQTMKPSFYEVIIVNDGSKDNSLNIIQKIAKGRKNWKIICQDNKGAAAARNVALNLAVGKYITILDSDDLLEKDALDNMYLEIEKNDADVGLFRTIQFNSKNEYKDLYEEFLKDIPNLTTLKEQPSLCKTIRNGAVLYKRKTNKDIRFIEGGIHEDIYYYLKSLSLAKKIYISNRIVYRIRLREGENSSVMQNLNFKTFNHCYNNILKADQEIKNRDIVMYNSSALVSYIALNIKAREDKIQAKQMFLNYLKILKKEKIISFIDYCYIILKTVIKKLLNRF